MHTQLRSHVGFFLFHNLALPLMGLSVHKRTVSPSILLMERVVEWGGAICSVYFFALAFTGTGKARIYILIASFCNFFVRAATI